MKHVTLQLKLLSLIAGGFGSNKYRDYCAKAAIIEIFKAWNIDASSEKCHSAAGHNGQALAGIMPPSPVAENKLTMSFVQLIIGSSLHVLTSVQVKVII